MESEKLVKIKEILNEARSSISDYCINECHAKCCRTGKLVLFNSNEIDFICQGKEKKFLKRRVLQLTKDGNYTYNHTRVKCPHLTSDFKCNDWKNENRPKVCSDFPLFFSQEKFIITAQTCPGVENKMFDKYLKKLEELGLKII